MREGAEFAKAATLPAATPLFFAISTMDSPATTPKGLGVFGTVVFVAEMQRWLEKEVAVGEFVADSKKKGKNRDAKKSS